MSGRLKPPPHTLYPQQKSLLPVWCLAFCSVVPVHRPQAQRSRQLAGQAISLFLAVFGALSDTGSEISAVGGLSQGLHL